QQCSFQPPQLTMALARQREVGKLLTAGAAFTLNILDDGQSDMISHFGRGFAITEPAFTGLDVLRGESNGPVLSEALAFLTWEVAAGLRAGDHDLIVATVVDGRVLGEGHPMVHIRKSGAHY